MPDDAIPLAAAIGALRAELLEAFRVGEGSSLRFEPSPVELTLQVAVTTGGTASAGIKWWLVNAGADVSRQSATTHTVKLTLQPRLFDKDGLPTDFLIEGDDDAAGSAAELPLDAQG